MLKQLDDNGKINSVFEVRNLLFCLVFSNIWIAQDVGNANLFFMSF